MKRRLDLAMTLMGRPRLIFLDEPTTGLDPQARLFVWDRIREMRTRGVTIILTTHDMDEATELCERVGIMDHGKILSLDTPAALTATVPGKNTLEVGIQTNQADREKLVAALGGLAGVEKLERVSKTPGGAPAGMGGPFGAMMGGPPAGAPAPGAIPGPDAGPLRLRLYLNVEAAALVAPVARVVTDAGAELQELAIGKPSLEDVFIHLTGRALR
jgi:ABC-2 type transport system ATP-binding protein